MNRRLLPVIIIALVSFAVYFNALSNDFVYDDKEQVVENRWIRDTKYIPDILTQSVWGFATEVEDQGTANYYRPFMHLVNMASYFMFGLKPWGFHLVNIIFHAGASVMVFFLLLKLLGREAVREAAIDSWFPAFTAAVLFAVHPIHTEAVTWVASLPEVAFTFFFLLSFYFYIRYREGLNSGYVLSLVWFSVSVFFKEPALTLPLIIILYDFCFEKKSVKKIPLNPPLSKGEHRTGGALRYIPYFIIAGSYLLLRLNALKSMMPTETQQGLSAFQSVINVFPLFMEYLKDLVFPFDLNFWHMFQPYESLFDAPVLISLVVTVSFITAVVISWKRSKLVFFGLLFIIVPLLPAFYIKGIGSKPYAERYLYMPSVGFIILLAFFLFWLRQKTTRFRLATSVVLLLLAGSYSVQTIIRNPEWKDKFAFYENAIRKSPDAVPLRIAYGTVLSDENRLDEAILQYRAAIRYGPNYWQAHENLGIVYGKKGLPDKAIEHIELALRLNPGSAVTRSNLGNAYIRKRMPDRAIEALQTALQINPDFFPAHFNLAAAYEQKGLIDKAIDEYVEALRLRPDNEEALYLLGRAYANSGRLDDAIGQFRTLAEQKPDIASYRNTLGALYAQKGLLEQAVGEFDAAVRLAPDKPSYRENRERALRQKGGQVSE